MRYLATLILALMLSGSAHALERPKTLEQQIDLAWRYACDHTAKAKCSQYERPFVYFSPEYPYNLRGQYIAESDYIVLNIRLLGQGGAIFTMTHEFVHFIQFQEGVYPAQDIPDDIGCMVEEEAFGIANAIADELQLTTAEGRGARWEDVKDQYRGCGINAPTGAP